MIQRRRVLMIDGARVMIRSADYGNESDTIVKIILVLTVAEMWP